MKVVHVTNRLSGGVLTAIENLVFATPEVQHSIVFVGDSPVELSVLNSSQFSIQIFVQNSNIFKVSKRVKEIALQLEVDVVHAHSSWAGIYSRIRSLPRPIIYQPHGFAFSNPRYSKLVRGAFWFVEKLLSLRTASLIAVGKHEEHISARLVGKQKVLLLKNKSKLPIQPWKTPNQASPVRIGTVGRVCAEKDPTFFLSIVNLMSDDSQKFEFYWIGDGDLDSKKMLAKAGVHVTGWLQGEEIIREVRELDIYVNTSISEGMPFALLDSLALGVPVILRDIPAFISEGFPTCSGPDDFAHAIITVSSNGLGSQDLKKFEEFRQQDGPSYIAENYRKSLRKIIGEEMK